MYLRVAWGWFRSVCLPADRRQRKKIPQDRTRGSSPPNKKAYYAALEIAQRSNEITAWISYFVNLTLAAQSEAELQIDFTLKITRFFDHYTNQLNERQQTVIKRMFQEGINGFQGGMNAGKYGKIAKTSKATATRDLQHLLEIGAFMLHGNAGGRSTSYQVNF